MSKTVYEVYTERSRELPDGTEYVYQVLETRRTDREAAEEDASIFKTLGRKAWIVEKP